MKVSKNSDCALMEGLNHASKRDHLRLGGWQFGTDGGLDGGERLGVRCTEFPASCYLEQLWATLRMFLIFILI